MSIGLAKADAFFTPANHVRAGVWSAVADPNRRTAAIAQAKRQLQRLLAFENEWSDEDTTEADFPRLDLATYEQALHILENSPDIGDGSAPFPRQLATNPDAASRVAQAREQISPEALRWMLCAPEGRGASMIRLVRG